MYFRLSINKISVCQAAIGIFWTMTLSNQRRKCKNVMLKTMEMHLLTHDKPLLHIFLEYSFLDLL